MLYAKLTTCVATLVLSGLVFGCVDVECGTGTHREGEYCVPNIPSACGEGTVYEQGWCVIADDVSADTSGASDVLVAPDSARDGGL